VVAVVVLAPGATLVEAATLAGLRTRRASDKVPMRGHGVEDLPRNAMGKVQKAELRRRYGG